MDKRFFLVLFLAFLTIITGTLGYHLIEGWDFLSSLYMTVITLSTVGFAEVYPLSSAGRIFTIFLIGAGIFTVTYTVSLVVSLLSEGKLGEYLRRREIRMQLQALDNHLIVCGCGVVGSEVVGALYKADEKFVVVDKDEQALSQTVQEFPDIVYLEGDATREEVLKEAGVERARGLLAIIGNDADNVYVVLTARFLNSHLRIVARAIQPEAIEILKRAGADYVICPQKIGGSRMAAAALRPQVSSFLDLVMQSESLDLTLDEVEVQPNSALSGKSLRELDLPGKIGLIVVAIKPKDKAIFEFNPQAQTVIRDLDTVIVLGRVQQLAELRKLATTPTSKANF